MDNAQKAIMIGVGLFITIMIISAVLLITTMGTGMINDSKDYISNISTVLQSQVTSAYDGKILNGAEVISACQLYENSDMSIVVYIPGTTPKVAYTGKMALTGIASATNFSTTAAVPGGVYTSTVTTHTTKATIADLQKSSAAGGYGVTSVNSYYSSVVKDSASGAVIGMVFVQVTK